MLQDRFLPRVWTDEGYYYPVFSELGITYENHNLPFNTETMKTLGWAFGWHFEDNVDDGLVYDHTLEMPTGLRDKNGKLIYEGDIVKIYAKNRYAYGIYQIKYYCDDCEYDMLDKEGDFIYQLQNDKTKYIEVIGNIHENKELLDE